ncbi:uncharacterized protein P884DRAFT_261147 [Thermothelomyces heterothallicus CBS 202.75]|uniref:uncharacterized protein n=1 Tax=Thermothelomyces heterothallicus CBS 202.75 TaxID=1149848 RepID=UPI003743C609
MLDFPIDAFLMAKEKGVCGVCWRRESASVVEGRPGRLYTCWASMVEVPGCRPGVGL